MNRISFLTVMKIYRWMESRRDGGLTTTGADIGRVWGLKPNAAYRLRHAYLNSRGVFYGNV